MIHAMSSSRYQWTRSYNNVEGKSPCGRETPTCCDPSSFTLLIHPAFIGLYNIVTMAESSIPSP
jgi:hypothetical protein